MTDLQGDDETPNRAGLPGCAVVTRLLGGSPAGTAAFMRSWLLIEQPGPWDADALERTLAEVFPPAQLERLERLRLTAGFRPLLIRRPGRHHRDSLPATRTVLVGGGAPGRRWLERLEIRDLEELAALDLDAVAAGRGGFGTPVAGPVFVVCTHGTKDMCCALLGRPVVAALDSNHPGRVWETSHVGGDRWAGNLLVVPDGYLHGQLNPDEASRVAKAALHGEVDPERLRGRTAAASAWSQYAEIAIRRHLAERGGPRGLDDVISLDDDRLPGEPFAGTEESRVLTVRAGERHFAVTVRFRSPTAQGASRCSEVVAPSAYVTEAIRPLSPA